MACISVSVSVSVVYKKHSIKSGLALKVLSPQIQTQHTQFNKGASIKDVPTRGGGSPQLGHMGTGGESKLIRTSPLNINIIKLYQ